MPSLVIIGILNVCMEICRRASYWLFVLIECLRYSTLQTYPRMTLVWHHSFKVDGKTTLNGCWPMQVLVTHSIPDLFASICVDLLVSGCAFSAILCFMSTIEEYKTVPLKTKQGSLQFGKDYGWRLYKDQKCQSHLKFYRPIWQWCLIVPLHTFLVGYILRAKRAKTKKS